MEETGEVERGEARGTSPTERAQKTTANTV